MKIFDIEQVIAHRKPMILISRLLQHDSNSARCEVDIEQNSAFFQSNLQGVPSYIGIEYMAQSIAAYAGAKALENDQQIEIGFLLGSRKYTVHQPVFNVGNTYSISVEKLYQEDSGLTVFECAIYHEDLIIAQAKVNAFQPNNPLAFLKEQQ
ncbi:ApeP family dehydratase [Thalassotalea ganghwensis]